MITRDKFLGQYRPDLLAAREAIAETASPLVYSLGELASFDGAVYFARDNFYRDTASTVEIINSNNNAQEDRYDFQRKHISGRRVDLLASRVGQTFSSGTQEYATSKMNPDHTVYGIPVGDQDVQGVLQLAFSEAYGKLPDEEELRRKISPVQKGLSDAALRYSELGNRYRSLADAELLDIPTTPNAFMVEWDLDGSTVSRHASYPMLRDYLNEAAIEYRRIFDDVGAVRVKSNGDGETYRIDLPQRGIDRNNLSEVGMFGNAVIKSVIITLLATHDDIAAKYDGTIGPLRVGAELGYYESTEMGESSPSMWDLAETMNRAHRGHNVYVFGSRAIEAFAAAKSLAK